jgi:hypothetical protein
LAVAFSVLFCCVFVVSLLLFVNYIDIYIYLPAFKIVKYFWWSSLFVISIVPQLFVNVAILLVFNKENEILGFYWVQQTSLVYPHV